MSGGARTGGCQCGRVRFRVEGTLGRASVCHCRMCQKAFGAFYAPLVGVGQATLTWTRGEPARFRSSNHVSRGFCAACGTPLTFETPEGVDLAIGAFDDAATIAPDVQYGTEGKLPYVDAIPALPGRPTADGAPEGSYVRDIRSRQHPDHETAEWPPEDEAPR